jgi:hypothetical protein
VPDADAAIRSALESKLALIRLDQNELNKQVVGLLVLNRFLPVNPVGSSSSSETNVISGVNNTMSEFISNQLSIYLSDWISKFVTDVQLDINYRTYQAENGSIEDPAGDSRRELQVALTKSFVNNRLFVDVGGNFDFGQGTGENGGTQNANNFAGDFEIQYSITPDGRFRAKVFRKAVYDIFEERNRNKTGVGIDYRQEFDNFKELMENLRRKRTYKNTAPPVQVEDNSLLELTVNAQANSDSDNSTLRWSFNSNQQLTWFGRNTFSPAIRAILSERAISVDELEDSAALEMFPNPVQMIAVEKDLVCI